MTFERARRRAPPLSRGCIRRPSVIHTIVLIILVVFAFTQTNDGGSSSSAGGQVLARRRRRENVVLVIGGGLGGQRSNDVWERWRSWVRGILNGSIGRLGSRGQDAGEHWRGRAGRAVYSGLRKPPWLGQLLRGGPLPRGRRRRHGRLRLGGGHPGWHAAAQEGIRGGIGRGELVAGEVWRSHGVASGRWERGQAADARCLGWGMIRRGVWRLQSAPASAAAARCARCTWRG